MTDRPKIAMPESADAAPKVLPCVCGHLLGQHENSGEGPCCARVQEGEVFCTCQGYRAPVRLRDRTVPFTREEFEEIEARAINDGDQLVEQMAGILLDTEAAFEQQRDTYLVLCDKIKGALEAGKYTKEDSFAGRFVSQLKEIVDGLATGVLEPELVKVHWEHGTPLLMQWKTNWASMIVGASIAETLRKEGGGFWNHVTMQMHYQGEQFDLTVQRKSGKSPKEILDEVKAERDAAVARATKAEAENLEWLSAWREYDSIDYETVEYETPEDAEKWKRAHSRLDALRIGNSDANMPPEIIAMLMDKRDEAVAQATVMRGAANALLESLGEYMRQSMDLNPEWRPGLHAMVAALATDAGKVFLDEVKLLRGQLVERGAQLLKLQEEARDIAEDRDQLSRDGQDQLRELVRLREALTGFSEQGAHHDTNPTRMSGGDDAAFYLAWIESMDKTVRDIARAALTTAVKETP